MLVENPVSVKLSRLFYFV